MQNQNEQERDREERQEERLKKRGQRAREGRERKISRGSKMETKGDTEKNNAFSEDKKMYLSL